MKLELMVRSRARENQSIEAKHAEFQTRLSAGGRPWGFRDLKLPPVGDIGGELIEIVSLSSFLEGRITGSVAYVYRQGLRDEPKSDDHLHMQFDPGKADYAGLLNGGFQSLIRDFGAYHAYIRNREFGHLDFDAKRRYNGRDHVFRINQACFMDRELCRRSFAREPEQIAALLEGELERVELISGGVLLVISTTPLGVDEERDRGDRIKALLLAALTSQK